MVIGLRILLRYQHYLDVPMGEADARRLIDQWESRHFHARGVQVLGGKTPTSQWACTLDDVIGMHTIAAPGQPAYDPSALSGGSGLSWKNQ